jgi:hypothetical protein
MLGKFEILIPVILVFVYILNHLLRNKEEDQPAKRTRPGTGSGAGRRPTSEIDRFLEEVNRRRRQAEERRGTASAVEVSPAIPTVVPARPARQPRSARPAAAAPPVRTATRRAATPVRVPAARDIPLAIEVEAAAAVSRARAEVVAVEAEQAIVVPGPDTVKSQPALFSPLDNPQNLRDALIWREVLSAPRCRKYGLRGL